MNKTYTVGEMAALCGVTVGTLQRLDRQGILKARRTITNRRYYTTEEYNKFMNRKGK